MSEEIEIEMDAIETVNEKMKNEREYLSHKFMSSNLFKQALPKALCSLKNVVSFFEITKVLDVIEHKPLNTEELYFIVYNYAKEKIKNNEGG